MEADLENTLIKMMLKIILFSPKKLHSMSKLLALLRIYDDSTLKNFVNRGAQPGILMSFFFYLGLLSRTFTNRRTEGISLTPHYHFHTLHRHLDISRAIAVEGSPLHIANNRNRTGNLWFPSASR